MHVHNEILWGWYPVINIIFIHVSYSPCTYILKVILCNIFSERVFWPIAYHIRSGVEFSTVILKNFWNLQHVRFHIFRLDVNLAQMQNKFWIPKHIWSKGMEDGGLYFPMMLCCIIPPMTSQRTGLKSLLFLYDFEPLQESKQNSWSQAPAPSPQMLCPVPSQVLSTLGHLYLHLAENALRSITSPAWFLFFIQVSVWISSPKETFPHLPTAGSCCWSLSNTTFGLFTELNPSITIK